MGNDIIRKQMRIRLWIPILAAVWVVAASGPSTDFRSWSLEKAIQILNDSPWARQETFTRVVGGVGSGIRGEKEIYNTFFVRFLSARPIREAFARINEIRLHEEGFSLSESEELRARIRRNLEIDVSRWIVVTVSSRSNNPSEEERVSQFFQVQNVESLRNQAFLSTAAFPRLQLVAYYPPRDELVGAKFVFPRQVSGKAVVRREDKAVTFELDVPGARPLLRVTFPVDSMVVDDQLVM